MADENQELNNEPVDNGTPAPETTQQESNAPAREYSEAEQVALSQGWVPEDEWDHSRGKWRPAEEFIERGQLFAKLDEHKRRADRLERTVDDLKRHHLKVRETEFKRALQELKAEKKAAIEDGDADRIVEIDDAMLEVKQAAAQAAFEAQQRPEPTNDPNPAFISWVNRNTWYQSDKPMKVFADAVAAEIVATGETDAIRILTEVEKRVKKEFSHKFQNPNRAKPGAVDGGGPKSKGSSAERFELTPEETQVMKRFVKAGVMTEKEYIAEVKAMRGA